VFALMLALRRNLLAYRADVDMGRWQASSRFCLLDHPIADLAGSQLGIVGYGALGQRVAALARAFGMRVAVTTRTPAAGVANLPLDELLASSDVVSLHLPLTEETRNLIGARELARMKPGALLINTARGGLVDEAALLKAVRSGQVAAAGLDSFAVEPMTAPHPFHGEPNLILSPHIGGVTGDAYVNMGVGAAKNVLDVLAQGAAVARA
jgi:glycerate dehydrogenase